MCCGRCLVNLIITFWRCLFFYNYFLSFGAGNCVSNFSFKWMKNSLNKTGSIRVKGHLMACLFGIFDNPKSPKFGYTQWNDNTCYWTFPLYLTKKTDTLKKNAHKLLPMMLMLHRVVKCLVLNIRMLSYRHAIYIYNWISLASFDISLLNLYHVLSIYSIHLRWCCYVTGYWRVDRHLILYRWVNDSMNCMIRWLTMCQFCLWMTSI